jgi:hypothetical protein
MRFILLSITLIALISCGKHESPQLPDSNNKVASKAIESMSFEDGKYLYRKSDCEAKLTGSTANHKCLTLAQFKHMCMNISGITEAHSGFLNVTVSKPFGTLILGGDLNSVDARWEPKSNEGKILEGTCYATFYVSGIVDGSSSKANYGEFIHEFAVINQKIYTLSGSNYYSSLP